MRGTLPNKQTRSILLRNLAERGYRIEIGKYSPGDGWTRYSVSINGWCDIRNGMTARECETYLDGLFDMLRVQRDAEMSGVPLAVSHAN